MDLPQIGAHCFVCNDLDLLPIKCPRCTQVLCRHHIHTHPCTAGEADLSSVPASSTQASADKLDRCSLPSCTSTTLERVSATPIICEQCRKPFCLEHRHADTHKCTGSVASTVSKNELARSLLAKHFGSAHTKPAAPAGPAAARLAASAKPVKVPTDPTKLVSFLRVEKMKMRHRAVPGEPKVTSAPLEERLHVSVDPGALGGGNDPRVFWFRKDIITGRALDLLTSAFGIPSTAKPQTLTLLSVKNGVTEHTTLLNSQELGKQIEDGSILLITDAQT